MALMTTRPWKHPKTGIYYLRRAVPADLLARVGKREEKISLGTKDPVRAKGLHASALLELEQRWANLRCGAASLSEREAHELAAPLSAWWFDQHRDEPSQQTFWRTDLGDGLWPRRPPGWSLRPAVGAALIEEAADSSVHARCAMEDWCSEQADALLKRRGLVVDETDRRKLARAVAAVMQRASLALHAAMRGEAVDVGQTLVVRPAMPTSAMATPPAEMAQNSLLPISLTALVEAWWREAERTGKAASTHEAYAHAFRLLVAFLGHDNAHRVTKHDIVRFKDHRLASRKRNGDLVSATTVKNSDLAALKAVFGWALDNGRIIENPALGVTVAKAAKVKLREREFTAEEARTLLRAASDLTPGRELPQTYAAKHWIPWVLAFTGARVGEIAQLRRQDLRRETVAGYPEGVWVLRITPEAGTVKTKQAREVPLHPQLVELGFPAFVEGGRGERLFIVPDVKGQIAGPLQGVKNRLSEFARHHVIDPGVSPNHSWRHRFRTVATEAGVSGNVIDALCGWSAKSVGERYGSVSLKARTDAIMRLPRIEV
ncbi:DUF6538 domain-containing protein [Methylorubrum salsuginis]|uniref:Site-specific recombinase XerD n=1 Tax=Methylorubrum salsuginis TaxID=414703 RepID=A0A1I4MZ11_9HYPH|nr:DUF6538 domain-containing protein [Methylorubrum salsuginis]SFM08200.1 Site-specific recombinase XerD [Methylorubrum salsuginis]